MTSVSLSKKPSLRRQPSNRGLQTQTEDFPDLTLSDFERVESNALQPPVTFEIPSQHSGFRSGLSSEADESEPREESESSGPWSPPAWRRMGGGWYQPEQQRFGACNRREGSRSASPERATEVKAGQTTASRETSPMVFEDAQSGEGDVTIAAEVPLPGSPLKRSPSPERHVKRESSPTIEAEPPDSTAVPAKDDTGNYIRFAVRAEVQHRTEPIDAFISFIRRGSSKATKSPTSTFFTAMYLLLISILLRMLFRAPPPGPVPDLVKVAGLAKSFEPLIHYSENGAQQIGDLQETGVAVWDLGESVRSTNMTSAPIIVRELDDLSESLKGLALELTRFFASVDGDVDRWTTLAPYPR